MHVVLIGDVHQLPPVACTSFFKGMVQSKRDRVTLIDTIHAQGVSLFKDFVKFDLKKQMRAAEDPQHAQFIADMMTTTTGLSDTMIRMMLDKQIKPSDVKNDPNHTDIMISCIYFS